ncbi:conserved protein of unknown function [Pseudomonas sp. JV551A1]|uniref:Uncharacterized protein n=1 Tax=Pseudomonas inefficax TaxID=2078786 RepID=A0AAQ1PE82_9PSED|nr:conserved protein of unknown function [Pseudomonas sp. JV551A1]SPO63655.1 conserved protein of unknown function [Pseudomonas inefficax]
MLLPPDFFSFSFKGRRLWPFFVEILFILLLKRFLVVAGIHLGEKLAIIFLDLLAPNQKNPISAVEGLPEADPLSRS